MARVKGLSRDKGAYHIASFGFEISFFEVRCTHRGCKFGEE